MRRRRREDDEARTEKDGGVWREKQEAPQGGKSLR